MSKLNKMVASLNASNTPCDIPDYEQGLRVTKIITLKGDVRVTHMENAILVARVVAMKKHRQMIQATNIQQFS